MSLFNFVKGKGESLYNWATGETANQESEAKITEFVQKFELPVNNFKVDVDGENACVTGVCPTQAVREKVVLAVGNINGIAQVDDKLTVETPAAEAKFYTVASGDTLSKIAKEFYGNPMEYNMIFEANKPLLADPNKIYPGQTLRIPNSGPTVA